MDKIIRWGILGTGKIAKAFATALRDVPDVELAAVASRSLDSATEFAREYGAKRAHGDYQALADDGGVDVIYIATPHAMHHENAIMCLKGGKALLVEKAFTLNRRQAQEIVDLARECKLFVMEAMWTRFQPAILEARRMIDAGEIGNVRNLQADFGFPADVGPEHRLFNPLLGGGSLLDLGIYPLSMAAFFLGPVKGVRGYGELTPAGVDMQASFVLQHEGGALSACSSSLNTWTPTTLTICGDKGFLRLHGRFHHTECFTISLNRGEEREFHLPRIGNGYAHEALEVGRCLREGLLESPAMPLHETVELMGVLDALRAQLGVRYSVD
jgi:predicted dehydrogenase